MIKLKIIIFLSFISLNLFAQDCDTTLWQHIYHPNRLIIQDQSCITVTGTVFNLKKEADGDYHIQLKVDSNYEMYLDSGNYAKQKGCLVLEIICACKITQEDAIDACQGYENQIIIPKKGDYIKVTGSYVYDKSANHGCTEIHPVTKLEIIN